MNLKFTVTVLCPLLVCLGIRLVTANYGMQIYQHYKIILWLRITIFYTLEMVIQMIKRDVFSIHIDIISKSFDNDTGKNNLLLTDKTTLRVKKDHIYGDKDPNISFITNQSNPSTTTPTETTNSTEVTESGMEIFLVGITT